MKIKLKPNETLRGLSHQSKWVMILPSLTLLLALLLVMYLPLHFSPLGFAWQFYLLIIVVLWWLRELIVYNLNAFLITSERLIVIVHKGFLKKEVFETPLERILNISFSIAGVAQSLGGFGNVQVHILGMGQPLVLKNVSRPAKLKDELWKIHLARGLAGTNTNQAALIQQFEETSQDDV